MPWTLADLQHVVRMSWGKDTCDPADRHARGQCGVTALVLNDLFGGDLVLGEVRVAGEREEYDLLRGRVLARLAAHRS